MAQALQACFQRVRNKETDRPVIFIIDEAHELFDEKLEQMLLQARKASVGLVLATQNFSKATKAGITDTLLGSTSPRIVSQVIPGDARKLASRMKTTPDFLTSLPKHVFAYATGDNPAVTIRAQANPLHGLEMRDDLKNLRKQMEYDYGPETDEPATRSHSGARPQEDVAESEDDDLKPSET